MVAVLSTGQLFWQVARVVDIYIVAGKVATENGFVQIGIADIRIRLAEACIAAVDGNAILKLKRGFPVAGHNAVALVRFVDTSSYTDLVTA